MLRIDRSKGTLIKLGQVSLTNAGITERNDLQALIQASSEEFFAKECAEALFVIGQEVEPSNKVADRIDLLAVDEEGRSVIIELKRGEHKLQLLQALTYASMISDWDRDQFRNLLSIEKRKEFDEFTIDTEVNEQQRIILIAEHYDYVILSTAQWLTEFYEMNITCYQVSLARDSVNGSEYLSAVQLFPPRPLADQARKRGALKREEANKFPTIEELLRSCSNEVIKQYFEEHLNQTKWRRNKRADSIVYPQSGKMRFRVRPSRESARVSQLNRFEGDESLWKEHLSSPTVADRRGELTFHLSTSNDIAFFTEFITNQLPRQTWSKSAQIEDDDTSEEES